MRQWFIIAWVLLGACNSKPYPDERINKFEDPQLVKIYELQDRRESEKLIPFLKAKDASHRQQAALAFASIQDTMAIPYLVQILLIDQDELPRRAAAQALGQIGSNKVAESLRQAFASETSQVNQRVILESIGKCIDSTSFKFLKAYEPAQQELKLGWIYGVYRAIRLGYTDTDMRNQVLKLIYDSSSSDQIQIMSANYMLMYEYKRDVATSLPNYGLWADQLSNEEAKNTLMRLVGTNQLRDTQQDQSTDSMNPYQFSNYIAKLEPTAVNKAFLLKQFYNREENVVLNACMLKLTEIEKAGSYYPEGFAQLIVDALNSGDMALQSIASYALVDETLPHAWDFVSLELLDSIKNALVLPRQKETYIDLSKAIAYKRGETFEAKPLAYNKPIDWEFVKSIPRDQKVKISTSKGDLVIQLFVEDAPASVANILKLIDSGFYDGKYFHRVVDHFVIQAGCPRGDGWGGLDWSQRSEFSNYQHYSEGTVGLASAGKDTEGVQWFITHQATPFLTGRYTIIARVTEGMDVVNQIEMGDVIKEMKRMP